MISKEERNRAAQHNEQDCEARLLRLPPEIRNLIYDLLIPEPAIYTNGRRWLTKATGDYWQRESFYEPATLQVCRQIRSEMLALCLGLHTYKFDDRHKAVHNGKSINLSIWLRRLHLVIGPFVKSLNIRNTIGIDLNDVYIFLGNKKISKARVVMVLTLKDGVLACQMEKVAMIEEMKGDVDAVNQKAKREAQRWVERVMGVLKDGITSGAVEMSM